MIARGLLDAPQPARTLEEEPRLQGCRCDVSDASQVRGLFRQALAHVGGLDVLVPVTRQGG